MKPLQPTGYRESPYERPGSRFVCGRPDAPCSAGPDAAGRCPVDPPCRPRLGERARLARATLAVAATAVAALTVMLAAPWRLRAVSPGPLAPAHEAIEAPAPGEPNCAACHMAVEAGPGAWLAGALGVDRSATDDARCLE